MSKSGQCDEVPNSLAMSSCSLDVTLHLFWPCLVACALAQVSSPFIYTPCKQPCKADTASFEVLKNFAIYLQDQRDCNFQASHYEIPAGVVCSCFFSKKSSTSFLSLNSSQSRVTVRSIDVLKLSRERKDGVFSSVGLMSFWIYSSCRNAAFIHMEKFFVAPHGFSVEVTGTHCLFCQHFNLKLQRQYHFVIEINLEMWNAWKLSKKQNKSFVFTYALHQCFPRGRLTSIACAPPWHLEDCWDGGISVFCKTVGPSLAVKTQTSNHYCPFYVFLREEARKVY